MKYIIILSLFLFGCTRAPTEGEIAAVASHQSRLISACDKIGAALGGKSEMHFNTTDGPMCCVYNKKNHNHPVIEFWEKEISAISRFLYIQENK